MGVLEFGYRMQGNVQRWLPTLPTVSGNTAVPLVNVHVRHSSCTGELLGATEGVYPESYGSIKKSKNV